MLLLVLTPSILSAQTKLKVAYPTTVGSMAVIWVTKDAKLFEKYGLDVELIYVAGSSRIVQSMLAKDIPISEIAIPAVIQANLAGADLVMLAGPNNKPGQKIMVKPEIKRREDLKGKKIGISRFGTSDDFLLRYVLGQWNLQADRDVALIQMGGSPETLAGLAAGAIDGGLLASPLHLQAAKFGYQLLADLSAIGIDYQGAGVVTTRSYMASKHLRGDINLAYPTGEIAVMGPEGAINIVFRDQLQKAGDPAKARDEMVTNYRETFANPFKAAESGYIDAVIYPEDTRPTLIRALEMLKNKQDHNPPKKHGNIPL